jgi:ATP-dependent protease ClpP protease subunit
MNDVQSPGPQVTLDRSDVSLFGQLTEQRASDFLRDLAKLKPERPLVTIEVSTIGGDAELARRLVLEIALARRRLGQRIVFVGKTQVYSAGVTLMSGFPKEDRYLSRDTVVMIHCRQLDTKVEVSGAMRASLPKVQSLLEEFETGLRLEEENFRRLIAGSDISLDELLSKAVHDWYLTAEEAHRRGLVAGLL